MVKLLFQTSPNEKNLFPPHVLSHSPNHPLLRPIIYLLIYLTRKSLSSLPKSLFTNRITGRAMHRLPSHPCFTTNFRRSLETNEPPACRTTLSLSPSLLSLLFQNFLPRAVYTKFRTIAATAPTSSALSLSLSLLLLYISKGELMR